MTSSKNKRSNLVVDYEGFVNSIKFMGKIINSRQVPFKDIEKIIDLSKTLDVFSQEIIQNIVKRLILLEYFEETKKEILRGLLK